MINSPLSNNRISIIKEISNLDSIENNKLVKT